MLTVPELPADVDTLGAAFAYAKAGWYVLPIKRGTKHPGSVLGKAWQQQSSRDPEQLAAWWAGTDHGIALHVGRSGAIVADVDYPERLPAALAGALFGDPAPPYQMTRSIAGRGHYVFAVPEGRTLGNGVGRLGGAWGEMRGLNGVIVVEPSVHPEYDGPGSCMTYEWVRVGPLPTLPADVAALLDDAQPGEDAATDAEVATFLRDHHAGERPELIAGWVTTFEQKVRDGESRHARMASVLAGALKEARAGYFPAQRGVQKLREAFLRAVAAPPASARQGDPRSGSRAVSEWQGLLAWAVGQARAANVDETRARIEDRMPADDLTFDPGSSSASHNAGSARAEVGRPKASGRHVVEDPVSGIRLRRPRWLWDQRVVLGALALLAGGEGLGKSTVAYQLAADLTNGTLPGEFHGTPRSCLVCATEDSYEYTIAPRLVAAGADLDRVFRVRVRTEDEQLAPLSLPDDLAGVAEAAERRGASMLILDPLMSRLETNLDSHRDGEVRRALEPLVEMAEQAALGVMGLIHHNKGTSTNPLDRVMASKAFTAVARSVLTVIRDPDDEARRLLGTPKNNLGRSDLPTLAFRIVGVDVPTDEGPASVGRIAWDGEVAEGIEDIMRSGDGDARSTTAEAAEWLRDHLRSTGGTDERKNILRAAAAEGYDRNTLDRARRKLGLLSERTKTTPPIALWSDPKTLPGTAPTADVA